MNNPLPALLELVPFNEVELKGPILTKIYKLFLTETGVKLSKFNLVDVVANLPELFEVRYNEETNAIFIKKIYGTEKED